MPAAPAAPLALPDGEVHVWHAAPVADLHGPLGRAQAALLDEAERSRAAAFRFDRHRAEYVTAHALLRTVLSTYAPRPPGAWRFRAGPSGKPALATSERLAFNLSHAHGAVCCAVGRGSDLGVDVEWAGRPESALEVAEAYFAPSEVAAVFAREGPERMAAFLDRWTLKEAYVKAIGTGLSTEQLAQIVVDLDDGLDVTFGPTLGDRPEAWHVGLWRPGPEHRAALAVRTKEARPRVRYWRAVPTVRRWETDAEGVALG